MSTYRVVQSGSGDEANDRANSLNYWDEELSNAMDYAQRLIRSWDADDAIVPTVKVERRQDMSTEVVATFNRDWLKAKGQKCQQCGGRIDWDTTPSLRSDSQVYCRDCWQD